MTFQSVVLQIEDIGDLDQVALLSSFLTSSLTDWELILVADGLSHKHQVAISRQLKEDKTLVNTKLLFLSGRKLGTTGALWAGVDAAIGDRITTIYSLPQDLEELRKCWGGAANSADAIFGYPSKARIGVFDASFNLIYKIVNKRNHAGSGPILIDLSRQFVHFLQKTNRPDVALRNAYIFEGFECDDFLIRSAVRQKRRNISSAFGRAMEILLTASLIPLRAISVLSLVGGALNLCYSIYVLVISLTSQVARGWTSMSLQLSGMFFLVTLVLAAMCEFLIFMQNSVGRGQGYFIKEQVFTRRVGFSERLNVTD